MAFAVLEKGYRTQEFIWDEENPSTRYVGRRSTLTAGPRLIARIEQHDLSFEDLGRSDAEEIIVLKAAKGHPNDEPRYIDYEDTETTNAYRSDLRAINRWLDEADIEFITSVDGAEVDTTARRLRRVFNNGSFEEGGRLWGGFWMNLSKTARRNDLYIDGEAIAELDYGQMALRLLYGHVGAELPEGDLYAVPGLESYREGVKKVINSALYADKRADPGCPRDHASTSLTGSVMITSLVRSFSTIAPSLNIYSPALA